MNPNADIKIETNEHWKEFAKRKLDLVVDPMILRTADLWLHGRSGVEKLGEALDSIEVRQALSDNADSLEAFFDAFLLSRCLPLIDYGITFDSNVGYETSSLCRRLNKEADEQLLLRVHVSREASRQAREPSLKALAADEGEFDDDLASAVVRQMEAYDYKWEPRLDDIEVKDRRQLLLARFQYGLLLFAQFAARAEVAHLIQPSRSGLFLGASTGARSTDWQYDAKLRDRLARIVEGEETRLGVSLGLDACPSFLPYLLSKKPNSTRELLQHALVLRRGGLLANYLDQRRSVIAEWQRFKRLEAARERELRGAVRAVMRELGIDAEESTSRIGVNLYFFFVETAPEKLGRWIPALGKKKAHSKILMRTVRAAHEMADLGEALGQLWWDS